MLRYLAMSLVVCALVVSASCSSSNVSGISLPTRAAADVTAPTSGSDVMDVTAPTSGSDVMSAKKGTSDVTAPTSGSDVMNVTAPTSGNDTMKH